MAGNNTHIDRTDFPTGTDFDDGHMAKYVHYRKLGKVVSNDLDPILVTPVNWEHLNTPSLFPAAGPRHKTLRQGGWAPTFPDSKLIASLRVGRLIAHADSITMSRPTTENDCERMQLVAADIVQHLVYFDAIELPLRDGSRILISAPETIIESLDVVLQAHF